MYSDLPILAEAWLLRFDVLHFAAWPLCHLLHLAQGLLVIELNDLLAVRLLVGCWFEAANQGRGTRPLYSRTRRLQNAAYPRTCQSHATRLIGLV